jgi:hypothetical protein
MRRQYPGNSGTGQVAGPYLFHSEVGTNCDPDVIVKLEGIAATRLTPHDPLRARNADPMCGQRERWDRGWFLELVRWDYETLPEPRFAVDLVDPIEQIRIKARKRIFGSCSPRPG